MAIKDGKAKPTRITHLQASAVVRVLEELNAPNAIAGDGGEFSSAIERDKLTLRRAYQIVAQRVNFPVNASSVEHLAAEMGIQFYRERPQPQPAAELPANVATMEHVDDLTRRLEMLAATVDAQTRQIAELRQQVKNLTDANGATVDMIAATEKKLSQRMDAFVMTATQTRLSALPQNGSR